MTHSLAFLLGVDPADADAAMTTLVEDSLGVRAVSTAGVVPVDYAFDSPATGGLYRVLGTDADGRPWSLFCKLLQHVRHWPKLAFIPDELRAEFAEQLPWRAELELWDPAVIATLPAGLRAPALHRVIDLGDDRLAVWQEDVSHDHAGWDLPRFARAARLLGRWNGRSTTAAALAVVGDLPPGFALRMYATNAVSHRGLGPLADDGLWSHPWLAGHADLRADLRALGARIPDLLDTLDTLPQCAPHGDASPQNLLADSDDGFVVIDLSFRSAHALGFDLGQLLVGLVHAEMMPAAVMPETSTTILQAYTDGLRDEGIVDADAVAQGFAISVLLRSAFDGFRYDLLSVGTEEARHAFDERVAMSRFLVEQFHTLVGSGVAR